jgi:competence protein ComEA
MKKNLLVKIFTITTITLFNISEKTYANDSESNMLNAIANIQLSGAVNKPGIYRFPKGTRLADALYKAGGLKKDAVITDLNLTTPISDETIVYIASKKEKEQSKIEFHNKEVNDTKKTENKPFNKNDNDIPVKKNMDIININTATEEEINSLPGIGDKLAKDIINYRTKHGKFKNINDLHHIHGIGGKKLEKIKKRIIL